MDEVKVMYLFWKCVFLGFMLWGFMVWFNVNVFFFYMLILFLVMGLLGIFFLSEVNVIICLL